MNIGHIEDCFFFNFCWYKKTEQIVAYRFDFNSYSHCDFVDTLESKRKVFQTQIITIVLIEEKNPSTPFENTFIFIQNTVLILYFLV